MALLRFYRYRVLLHPTSPSPARDDL